MNTGSIATDRFQATGDVVSGLARLKIAAAMAYENSGLSAYNLSPSLIEAIVRQELPSRGYEGLPARMIVNNQEVSPEEACFLVAAILKDKADRLRKGQTPSPELEATPLGTSVNSAITRIWQQGQDLEQAAKNITKLANTGCEKAKALDIRAESRQFIISALISSFNPNAGDGYIAGVKYLMDASQGRAAGISASSRANAFKFSAHRGGVPNLEDVQAYPKLPAFLAGARRAGFVPVMQVGECA